MRHAPSRLCETGPGLSISASIEVAKDSEAHEPPTISPPWVGLSRGPLPHLQQCHCSHPKLQQAPLEERTDHHRGVQLCTIAGCRPRFGHAESLGWPLECFRTK